MNLKYEQTSFLGGLAARFDSLRPNASAYPLLINGRVRENAVEPIFQPLQDTTLNEGLYQNITAVGSILIVFVSGAAYYRDTDTANGWAPIVGVAMTPTADEVDTASIPASTVNYKRTGPIDAVKFNNSSARTSEEGILATDGILQPFLIYPQLGGTLAGRVTFDYSQWHETADGLQREYVPVGRYPVFVGQKLYMAIKSTGGFLNRIAQSVSGRPLDFVVAIDNTTGDKAGDALTTSHAVGLDPLSGLYATSFDDGSFIATNQNNTTGITPDFQNGTFFGEPFLRNTPLFPTGALNAKCAVDINGDAGFITPTGIHSFDATAQKRVSSNNDPVAIQIYRLLASVQTFGCTADFRDYAFFAVTTIYGPGVAVYDKTLVNEEGKRGKFVALDFYTGIGEIKQFARTTAPSGDRLFFITADNRLFEFGAASTRETCRFYIGDWNSANGGTSQNLSRALAVFSSVAENTDVQITQYVDHVKLDTVTYPMRGNGVNTAPIIPIPYALTTLPSTGMVQFEPSNQQLGFSVGLMIEWATGAKLVFASIETGSDSKNPGTLSQLYQTSLVKTEKITKFAFVGDFDPGALTNALVRLPQDVVVIGMGDFFYDANHNTNYAAYAQTLQVLRAQGRLFCVAGNHDLDFDSGLVYNNTFGNGQRHARYVIGDCEIFFYNSGWDTAHENTTPPALEPDGCDINSVQASELKANLAASTAKFKFVVTHQPPYTSGNRYPGALLLRLPFKAWGATAVFSAHDHIYQRHIVDGLTYLGCGTGGRDTTPINALKAPGFQNAITDTFGYLSVTTDTFNVNTGFIAFDGVKFATTPFDPFTFRP